MAVDAQAAATNFVLLRMREATMLYIAGAVYFVLTPVRLRSCQYLSP